LTLELPLDIELLDDDEELLLSPLLLELLLELDALLESLEESSLSSSLPSEEDPDEEQEEEDDDDDDDDVSALFTLDTCLCPILITGGGFVFDGEATSFPSNLFFFDKFNFRDMRSGCFCLPEDVPLFSFFERTLPVFTFFMVFTSK
jgi:hypothetical protein